MKFFKKKILSNEVDKGDIIKETLVGVKNKFPIISALVNEIPLIEDCSVPTAGTDGNAVYYNKKFLETLTPSQRKFVLAHEYLHIHFNHIKRGKDKDPGLWNIATDAVINAKLEEEKFVSIKGSVHMEEGKTMSADEIYNLLKSNTKLAQNIENVQNHNKWENSKSSQNNNSNQGSPKQEDNKKEQDQNQQDQEQGQNQQDQSSNSQDDNNENKYDDAEKEFTKLNKQLKEKIAKQFKSQLIEKQKQNFKQVGKEAGWLKQNYGPLEEKKAVVSWKKLLRREVEKEEDRWTYRRANEDNYFQAGISSLDSTDMPITEVLIDTSGSVGESLIREFLMQLKPLLKESKLKVACFDSDCYDFVEIKNTKDIDNFVVYGGGGTDFDNAVQHFSKDKRVNKIVFTDGYDEFTLTDPVYKNVIWLVYERTDFKPRMGKVINVDVSKIMGQSSEYDDLSY